MDGAVVNTFASATAGFNLLNGTTDTVSLGRAVGDPEQSINGGKMEDLRVYNTVLSTSDIIAAASSVPEPTTVVLLTTGLLGLLAYAWRRRR